MSEQDTQTVGGDQQEIWKPVPGYPGYEASDAGRVRSCRSRGRGLEQGRWMILTPWRTPRGYLAVAPRDPLRKKNAFHLVHRVVLMAFVGLRPDGCQCRHLNGVKTDNRLSNLRWGTAFENAADKARLGRQPRGENHNFAKLDEATVRRIRSEYASGDRRSVIATRHGMSWRAVDNIVKRETWRHLDAPPAPA